MEEDKTKIPKNDKKFKEKIKKIILAREMRIALMLIKDRITIMKKIKY